MPRPPYTLYSQTVTVTINAPPERVADFVTDPLHLPLWVPSFCKSVVQRGEDWVVNSPLGPVVFAFAPPNPYGVLDHAITLPDGQVLHNAMRAVPNGQGSVVMFTLLQQAGMSDAQFEHDAELVHSDLQTLKRLLER